MTTRDKLIRAMHRADLSGFDQLHVLNLYDKHGLSEAMEYVDRMDTINTIIMSELKYLGVLK